MVKALDLPELRAYLGEFLDEKDLATCLCVCRDWHDTFMPLRWRDVRIIGIHSIRADVNLRKHAHLVRSLSFLRIISLLHFSQVDRYNQLERIHITKTDIDGRRIWEKFSALVRHNYKTLRVMILEDMVPLKEFLIVLGNRKHDDECEDQQQQQQQQQQQLQLEPQYCESEQGLSLESLMWKRVKVYVDCHALFWKACERAHSLVLECLTVKGLEQEITPSIPFLHEASASGSTRWPPAQSEQFLTSSPTESPSTFSPNPKPILPSNGQLPPPSSPPSSASATLQSPEHCRIKHIRVSWTISLSLELQLFLWILPCSQLESLVWEAFTFQDSIMSRFSSLLRSHSWPFLTSLDITSCMTAWPTDASLAMMLDASPNLLERLCLKSVDFGPLAFKSLMKPGRHFERLKTFMLINCGSKVTSVMARVVLENCKKLEIFYAPYLLVKDIEIPDEIQEHGQERREDFIEKEFEPDRMETSSEQDIVLSPHSHPRPWTCLELHTLYIGATAPSYASPPLTKVEEGVIRRRLKSLRKLRNYQVGASISSASPPWRAE